MPKVKPFDDPRVRVAIAHAIRREDIIKAAFFGRGAPIEGLPRTEGTAFYDARRWLQAHGWPYDPAKAKALLAAAGIGNGFTCKLLSTAQYGMQQPRTPPQSCNRIWPPSGSRRSWCCPTGRRG